MGGQGRAAVLVLGLNMPKDQLFPQDMSNRGYLTKGKI